ncbi:hypothetical protein [Succinimonas sp.]|uniref:hypothetical protein n=1 Tax=Succinimonas sp. TaxID=1936151 RepID=UPI00386E6A60
MSGSCLLKFISCLSAVLISGLTSVVPVLAAEPESAAPETGTAGEEGAWALAPAWWDDVLSTGFCLAIIAVFIFLIFLLIKQGIHLWKKISFIKKSLQEASGGDQSLYNRCEVTDKFLNVLDGNEQLKHAGRIFRNMLTRYRSNGSWHYCNRGQAREVFNELTLGYEMFHRKPFIPGLLTGIGVLGTFVGLLYGLKDSGISDWITGTGGELPEEEIKLRLGALLSGAGMAFVTSVWGITFSMFSSAIIRGVHSFCRNQIRELCKMIDLNFPPNIASETALSSISDVIEDTSVQGAVRAMSREIVTALDGMSERMTTELSQKITMYIRDMDNRTTDVILKTLDKLEDRLNRAISLQTETVKTAGEEFVNSARTATGIITAQYEKIGSSLDNYHRDIAANVAEWQQTSETFGGFCQELNGSLRDSMAAIRSDREALEQMTAALNAAVKQLGENEISVRQGLNAVSDLTRHFDERITALRRATEALEKGIQELKGFEPRISESLDGMLAKNAGFVKQWSEAYNRTILTGVKELSNAISSMREG